MKTVERETMNRHFSTLMRAVLCAGLCAAISGFLIPAAATAADTETAPQAVSKYLGPSKVVVNAEGPIVICEDAGTAAILEKNTNTTARMGVYTFQELSGFAITADRFAATFGGADGRFVCGLSEGDPGFVVPAGHTPVSPVFSKDGKTLYVPCRFSNDVAVFDVEKRTVTARVPAVREPIAAALTPDGKTLVVANHLPEGRSDTYDISAVVTLIDTVTLTPTHVRLLNGSTGLRDVAISPDGKYAYLPHILARYQMPTTQLERGWMNTNALSIFDIQTGKLLNTVLLDDVDRGAAGPWGVAVTPDGKTVVVTHSGTHEASILDMAGVLEKIAKTPLKPAPYDPNKPYDDRGNYSSPSQADIPNDLAFLVGLRTRVPLPTVGPRGVAIFENKAYIAGYFSDNVAVIDLATTPLRRGVTEISLGPKPEMTLERRGQLLFSDATLCFQNWQSCESCHPDARTDGLNWDLMNDGMGNPKNNRSMLLAHVTPPSMWSGVRPTAEGAVRSGVRHILMLVRPEEEAVAIDAYLKSLQPVLSPRIVDGQLSESARRGEAVFEREGCSYCHPAPLYTDLKMHDMKTRARLDERDDFDTPTLIECWRTAPYLHDGRYATMREVFTDGSHGLSTPLSEQDLTDLVEYVESL